MSVYIPHIKCVPSTMSPQALVYIHFTLMTYAPAIFHMYIPLHINSTLLHLQVKPVCCDLSSNIHIYYEFSIHIYSLPSVTTSVFLFFTDIFLFSVFMLITWETIHQCV